MDLTFVTGNKNKVKEAEKILGFPIKVHNMELDEIQNLDASKLVIHKAEQAQQALNRALFVDDAGIYLDAWNGFPGPFIKWLMSSGGNELLLKMLKGEKNRHAVVKLSIGFHDGDKVHVFQGEVKGKIANVIKGEASKGWFDPIFIPEGYTRTFAEMSLDEKNEISHRRKALNKFKKFLKENNYVV